MKAKKRVLLVDDEIDFTRLLKLSLEQTGEYEVHIENLPDNAVETARRLQPDLIILDVMMPRQFGGDVAERIRTDKEMANIPILFLSAAVGKQFVEEREGVIAGFPILAKPVSFDELLQAMEGLFERNAPAQDYEECAAERGYVWFRETAALPPAQDYEECAAERSPL